MQQRTCTVPECDKPTRSPGSEWCAMHYHRWYRHGDVNRSARTSGVSVSQGRRYRLLELPGHPLAKASHKVWEHQVVLYGSIGPGSHPCHWCGSTVRWEAAKGEADRLVVDHLNAIGDDNRIDNLVPSCATCNSARGTQARSDALIAAGWWSSHDTIAGLKHGARRPRIEQT